MVQRFTPYPLLNWDTLEPDDVLHSPDEDGEWVLYSAHVKALADATRSFGDDGLEAENARLRHELGEFRRALKSSSRTLRLAAKRRGALVTRLARALDLLRGVQWQPIGWRTENSCIHCDSPKSGHSRECALSALLAECESGGATEPQSVDREVGS